MSARHVEIACELRHETEKAFLIHDGTKEIWLPKSMVEFELDKPGATSGTATMPEWFAQEKGLI